MINKVLQIVTPIETKAAQNEDELIIAGYASTNDKDRMGDVVLADAWKQAGALDNYLKNPVVLAYHDMSKPVGKTINHEVDKRGLKITAKISKAAGDIAQLIKDGIISTFSIGFLVKDADYDSTTDIFVIKEVELLEVSVVTIPANASATFSVAKNFNSDEEYEEFKKQFNKTQDISEENLMKDEKDNKVDSIDLGALAKQIREEVERDLEAKKKAEAEAAKKKAEEEAKLVSVATTAAERLVKDLEDKILNQNKDLADSLKGLHDAINSNKEELQEVYSARSKMNFKEDNSGPYNNLTTDQKDGLIIASKIFNRPVTELKSFENLVTKSGMEHWANGTDVQWEEEYSTRVQNDMRQQLVVESLFSTIPMSQPTMTMPINPEAGDATWIHESAYRSNKNPWDRTGTGADTSTGTAIEHTLQQQTMVARKLATREYVGYEEEEDSIVLLAPIIRDAVARRMAKASDKAHLSGTGVLTNTGSYDPITGIQVATTVTPVTTSRSGANIWSNFNENLFVDMRKNLGLWGINPSDLVCLVAHDTYYEMMKFTNFKTVDVLGDKATILTGQVGSLFGVRVLVSQQFDNNAVSAGTVGTIIATMVNPRNYLRGELRGITSESDRDIINQQRVLVSSRRFAFNDIIANVGAVNLEFVS